MPVLANADTSTHIATASAERRQYAPSARHLARVRVRERRTRGDSRGRPDARLGGRPDATPRA